MNPIETFGEFSKKLTPTDLALYAGVGIVLWVLFKDKLSPIQKVITDLLGGTNKQLVNKPVLPTAPAVNTKNEQLVDGHDVFFDLVASWKQTRDLAVLSGCIKAVQVADEMFPYLSPVICKEENKDETAKY